jgi:TatD DNase family protein
MHLIDSHCHLDHFSDDEAHTLVARARDAGVAEMVTIGTRLERSDEMRRIADRHAGVWCTVGIHPDNVGENPVPTAEAIMAETDHPKVIGIGESGLDYFHEKAPRADQQASFRAHIDAARRTGLPLAIHARAADDDVLAILQEEQAKGVFPFLLHCFSSGRALAEGALALGAYISFSGILTFPKSQELRDIARDVPRARLLVETDSPYLAPVPYRGKRNEPSYVAHTAGVLAGVHTMSPAAMAELTTANFRTLFAKAA